LSLNKPIHAASQHHFRVLEKTSPDLFYSRLRDISVVSRGSESRSQWTWRVIGKCWGRRKKKKEEEKKNEERRRKKRKRLVETAPGEATG